MVVRIAHDDPSIAEDRDTFRLADTDVQHVPLPQQGSVRIVDGNATRGIENDELIFRTNRQAPRSWERRAFGRELPRAPLE